MDAYKALASRKSIRDFKNQAIDKKIIKKIINAGLCAPSNNHLREWEFVIVQDRAARLKVIDKIQKKYTQKGIEAWLDSWNSTDSVQRACYLAAVPKQYTMLLTAGCLILPFFRQPGPLLKPKSLSDLNALASIWCCIENMLIAAAAEGIYGVTRIPFSKEINHIKEICKSPEDYEIACYLALGYPGDQAKQTRQRPVKAQEKIHWNSW
ncbi:MAG: nitroreductase family protein [Spirochaetales bacterium]|nr:nitroreductase family protein [Spirochaetales bacterium]